MVTLVGTQNDFSNSLKELIELDFDAVEAYQAAINRLESETFKMKFKEFLSDHERHIRELSELLRSYSEDAPEGPSIAKQWLTKGKVVLANIVGDKAILQAMSSNEIDTNVAYERMNQREDKWPESIEILQRGLEDEKRHKNWIEEQLVR